MKIKQVRALVDTFTGKASELCRQLAFAGIAVIWVFKNSGDKNIIPNDFLLPLFFLVLALAFDFLQYIAGSIEWLIFNAIQEHKYTCTNEDTEVDSSPNWINYPHTVFFILKMLAVIASYVFIVKGLSARL
ncbi:hypothetical protein [Dyella sp. 2HG41-7]|uniref:hypothetical protein n=1 Tax=Dyella sp. 2HG41-7 TaxID=2883239 RepID=UPI001F445CB6|nr:hypothetical protein [Dyella sp. 2HG41-7]